MNDPLEDEADRGGVGVGKYLQVVRRRRWVILPIIAVAVGAAALFSSLQTPVYEAQAKIVIGQGNTLFQPQYGNVIQPFTATMADLLQSDIVARQVVSSLGLTTSPASVLQKVSVSTNPQTAVLQLSVRAQSPQEARRIAAAFATAFTDLVQSRFGHAVAAAKGVQPQPPISAAVFDPAHVVPGKIAPTPLRNLAIAAALGLVLGLAAGFLVEQFDDTVRTRRELEEALGMPVVGEVPAQRQGRVEAYRSLRAMLYALTTEPRLRTLLVTSALETQGKEMLAANLARSVASAGVRTLLIEGDLRQPLLDAAFDHRSPGLTDVLLRDAPLAKALRPIVPPPDARGATGMKLDLLPSGSPVSTPAELLSSPRMMELFETLAGLYDCVLVNASPLLVFPDALHLAHIVDGVIVVAPQDGLRARDAHEVRSVLDRLDSHAIGVVVTGSKQKRRFGAKPPPLTKVLPGSNAAKGTALPAEHPFAR